VPTVSKAILFNLKDQKVCIKDFERKKEWVRLKQTKKLKNIMTP
jgi:hypothetical protein